MRDEDEDGDGGDWDLGSGNSPAEFTTITCTHLRLEAINFDGLSLVPLSACQSPVGPATRPVARPAL